MEQIFKTTEYGKFKFIDTNRKVGDCKALKKSIMRLDLTPWNPIKVTPNFEIIDGQNRFKACMELKKPIYYTIIDVPGIDVDDVITTLNTVQKNWNLNDYVAMYTKKGVKNYVDFAQFVEYHHIQPNQYGIMAGVFTGKEELSKNIKAGKLAAKWERADELMGIINSLNRLKYYQTKHFVRAMLAIFKSRTSKELAKLLRKIDAMPYYGSVSAFTAAMNNLIDSNR